jgi:hypothetical protein
MQQRAEQLLHRVIAEEGGNPTPIGGRCEINVAVAAGTPCAVSPLNLAEGSLLDRPATIRVKKIPMDNTNAEFWKVAIMPPSAPRLVDGTEFIISAQFGEKNRPEPKPLRAMTSANSHGTAPCARAGD